MELGDYLNQYGLLLGVAAFVAALVNVLKFLKIATDGTAANWALGLNLLGFVLFVVANIAGLPTAGVDAIVGSLAALIMTILGLLGQLVVSRGVNAGLRGTPLIGYSHSVKR